VVVKKQIQAVALILSFLSTPILAGELSTRAAVGGGLGGALGAFLGSELGGRSGAILGGGLGGAAGSAIATDGYRERRYYERRYYKPRKHKHYYRHDHGDWDD
jgi:hypothetical protein